MQSVRPHSTTGRDRSRLLYMGISALLLAILALIQPVKVQAQTAASQGSSISGPMIAGGPKIVTVDPTCAPAWKIVATPPLDSRNAELEGVKVIAANDAWAVGAFVTETMGTPNQSLDLHAIHKGNGKDRPNSGYLYRTLIQHWDGASWSIVPSPNVGTEDNELLAIDGVAGNDLWAVGSYYNNYGVSQPLVEHWDGTSWIATVGASNGPLADHSLSSVHAISATDVWAVGAYSNENGALQTLTSRWDGTRWSIISSPNVGMADNILRGVSAVSTNDIWAVGYIIDSNAHNYRGLTLHWNGTDWSIVPTVAVGSGGNEFVGVTAVSSNDAWVVGNFGSGRGGRRGLTEHWNGTQWTVVENPPTGTDYSDFIAVDAASSNDIWVVGNSTTVSGGNYGQENLVEHWNGSAWSIVRGANVVYSRGGQLSAVDAVSSTDAWAVGTAYINGSSSSDVGITAHYSTECWPVSCTVSFRDVSPTDYFSDAVHYLYCLGAVAGYSDGTFRPGNETTRAQFTKMLVFAENWPVQRSSGYYFTDLSSQDPFYPYVQTALLHGVISGYADHTFRPSSPITRAQLSKVIVLAQGWPIDTTAGPHFSDVPPTHALYAFIETVRNHGIVSGYEDGTFRPGNSATRGQISKILFNAMMQPVEQAAH